jgi:tyrosyl-tRNA synthetase
VNGQKEVPIVDLLVSAFGKSKREARQLLSQNGVRVDGTVASEHTKVPVKGEPLLQIGKRQAARVRFR